MSVLVFLLVLFVLLFVLHKLYINRYYKSLYPKRDIRGETILITGGASGIGRAQADVFAKLGAKLILWDVNSELLEKAREELSAVTSVRIAVVDVSKREAVAAAAVEAGPIDVLVNNAGIVNGKPILQLSDTQIERIVAINELAHFWTIRAFLPGMLERDKGQIVCISSQAGLTGCARLADYSATKHALVGLMESLTLELRQMKSKVIATTVCPYFVRTGLFDFNDKELLQPTLPVMTPEFVAQEIVDGVVRGIEHINIPGLLRWIVGIARLMPYQLQLGVFEGTFITGLVEILRKATK
jgi:all-trans-retinol dehydrogenase (NAD+)